MTIAAEAMPAAAAPPSFTATMPLAAAAPRAEPGTGRPGLAGPGTAAPTRPLAGQPSLTT
ncbi:hypothetical protein [Frankia sp. AgB32]|uniref:hypothetical protein n=1 Tax=Frankia sp. AgB32 TaxID=631119 RepID=UPI00200FF535|nr:hypothetical protein [Frankia sp. AgB32]MCK9894361.1 hypothetical protein [Frankia sp. AgB32]